MHPVAFCQALAEKVLQESPASALSVLLVEASYFCRVPSKAVLCVNPRRTTNAYRLLDPRFRGAGREREPAERILGGPRDQGQGEDVLGLWVPTVPCLTHKQAHRALLGSLLRRCGGQPRLELVRIPKKQRAVLSPH